MTVKEKPLQSADGRIKGKRIAIRKDIPTLCQKACVLAEELGHHYTAVGNIIDIQDVRNIKQKQKGRIWAYDKMIGLIGIINAYERHCLNRNEMAEFLDVTEEFLQDALLDSKYDDSDPRSQLGTDLYQAIKYVYRNIETVLDDSTQENLYQIDKDLAQIQQ